MEPIAAILDGRLPVPARTEAARALSTSTDPRALDALAAAMESTAEELRDACKASLRRLEAPAGFARRLGDAGAGPDVRRNAARALRHLQEPASVPALAACLADPDEALRRECAQALAVFGAAAARDALLGALSDGSGDVRYMAALALRPLASDPEVRAALEARAGVEADAVVKDELARALR